MTLMTWKYNTVDVKSAHTQHTTNSAEQGGHAIEGRPIQWHLGQWAIIWFIEVLS